MSLSGERPMLTGRVPTGTSLTVFASNIRLSFAILRSSCGTVSGRFFSRSTEQPREPSSGFRAHTHDNHSDVVHPTPLVGQGNKLFRGPRRIRLRLQSARNFRLG